MSEQDDPLMQCGGSVKQAQAWAAKKQTLLVSYIMATVT
jgi:hypothetical protein